MLLSKMHLILEELVEGGEINRVLLGTYGHQVSLGMDRKVGVVSLVGEKQRDPCAGMVKPGKNVQAGLGTWPQ